MPIAAQDGWFPTLQKGLCRRDDMTDRRATIWITGAAGFIGDAVARCAVSDGYDVWGVDRLPTHPDSAFVSERCLRGNVDAGALDGLAGRSSLPAAIIHLAGGSAVAPSFAEPAADFAATVGSTVDVLDWVRGRGLRIPVVLASSAAVYGASHKIPISETGIRAPASPYGAHKAMMEDAAFVYSRFFGIDVRVARLFSVYGAGLRKQVLWDLCQRLRLNTRVVLGGTGREMRDFIHVQDAARAMLRLAQSESPPPVVNVATGLGISIAEVAALVSHSWASVTGNSPVITFSNECRPGDPNYLVADVMGSTALGLEPSIPLARGIDEYVRWFLAATASSGS